MKRVLIFGLSPLPTENDCCTLAPGKRTWQFVRPLLQQGHRVCLVCCRHLAAYQELQLPAINAEEHGNLVYYSVDQSVFENTQWLQRIHDNFEPDCIIGATVFPSFIATRLQTEKPIWADLFGHMMAEAQTKSFVFNDNYYLSKLWRQEQQILDTADVFSVVSEPQSYATIGELGARYRLNRATTGYSFTRVIPCSINDHLPDNEEDHAPVLRGKLVPDDAFVILWSGGYNTWTDIDTLFNALETVFARYSDLYFVSTGGKIASHDEITYQSFLDRIDGSKFKQRYVLRGWIPFQEVPRCVMESDIGINIDLFSYEGVLGSRNRLMDWMHMKLPLMTSELCHLSRIIKEKNLGLTFTPENTDELIDVIDYAYHNREKLTELSERAFEYVVTELSSSETTRRLVEWVDNPCKAPDFNDSQRPAAAAENDESLKVMTNHYHASIRNNIQTHGIWHTVKWIAGRSPILKHFLS